MLQHVLGRPLVQRHGVQHGVLEDEPAVAGEVHVHDLDVGVEVADVVLPRQGAA